MLLFLLPCIFPVMEIDMARNISIAAVLAAAAAVVVLSLTCLRPAMPAHLSLPKNSLPPLRICVTILSLLMIYLGFLPVLVVVTS